MLHHIYETRARSYRDAVQEFVEGYKEGYIGQPADRLNDQSTADTETKLSEPGNETKQPEVEMKNVASK